MGSTVWFQLVAVHSRDLQIFIPLPLSLWWALADNPGSCGWNSSVLNMESFVLGSQQNFRVQFFSISHSAHMLSSLTLTAGACNNRQIFVASLYKMVQLSNREKYLVVQKHAALFDFFFSSIADLPYSTGRITKWGMLSHVYRFYSSQNVCVLIILLKDNHKNKRSTEGLWLHTVT